VDGLNGRVLDVVVPGLLGHRLVRVAPADHKSAVALADRITNQRVLGLQIEDVELVDARGHQQERLFIDLWRERLVFDQLEKLILKNHRTFGGGHVFAHFKQAFVGHRNVPLLQVMHQVLHALGDALALGVDGFLLRLGIEGQKIAGRSGSHPLLDGKPDASACFLVGFHRVGQPHQGSGIEQIRSGIEGGHGVSAPGFARKPSVFDLQTVVQALIPHFRGVFEVLTLQGLELFRREFELRHSRIG
jgi:hypothetical protein